MTMSGWPGQKIALSGAFSSGKTTLYNALRERFPQLQPHPELATAAKSVAPSLDWRRPDVRGYLRWAQILAERGRELDGGVGLFDGSVADLIAHERVFASALAPLTRDELPKPYELTLLCDPFSIPVEINGIRETDEQLRAQIHALVVEEVERSSLVVVELAGPLNDRIARAADAVRDVLDRI